MNHFRIYIIFLTGILLQASHKVRAQAPVIPMYKTIQILVKSNDKKDMSYLAFPSLLRLSDNEILVSFKQGNRHIGGEKAILNMLDFDTENNRILDRQTIASDSGIVYQMGEWVQFSDNSIAVYTDTQQIGDDNDNYRVGMREVWLKNEGKNLVASKPKIFQRVDGREYGYPFEFIVDGNTTYMLVMAFGYRPGDRWSVDVIKSEDNGDSWRFIRNLKKEFGGHPINESSFIPWEDGFLVTTRGYGPNQRIYKTDSKFRMLKKNNLSKSNDFIGSVLGRPRLFSRDGQVYLIGRNYRTTESQGGIMELALFCIDPETLQVTKWVILDNAELANITDGYYAVPYFQNRNGTTYFDVITYRAANNMHPDIIRLEYKWKEIR